MTKEKKTNAMRILERADVAYTPLYYDLHGAEFSGGAVATLLGVSEEQSFKTLTAGGRSGGYYVLVIPVGCELDLKKAAASVGEKSVELLPVKQLLQVTGYVRGEVSPVGMKKRYPAIIDGSALNFDEIYVSAGAKGASMAVPPAGLAAAVGAKFADIVKTRLPANTPG